MIGLHRSKNGNDSSPKQFRGKLTPAEIAAGMTAAARNARRLASDAILLLEAKRFPTAASLAALAVEEAGKVSIFRVMALARNDEEVRAAWREYRSHLAKNGAWILPQLAAEGARRLDQLRQTVERDGEHNKLLNAIKQLGFYTDCYGDKRNWSEPEKVIDEALASTLVRTAEILAPKAEEHTAREIELWIKHLGPSWMTSEMPHALLRWQAAMVREGLSETSVAEMEAFVLGAGVGTERTDEGGKPS
jgi:AbiV family abortive infection protein